MKAAEFPNIQRHVIPREEWRVVNGYKTLVVYSCEGNTAHVAVKDNAKRQTVRVWVHRIGKDDIIKRFSGINSLWQAQTYAHDACMPPLTPEQIKMLVG